MKQLLLFIMLSFPALQAQTLDTGVFSSLGREEATQTAIQLTAICGQPFDVTKGSDLLSYGFTEVVSTANEATEITGISLDKDKVTIEAGSNLQLTATLSPVTTSNPTIKWYSSNPSAATVSEGKVTAVNAGEATITATSACGMRAAECTVTVKSADTAIDQVETGNKVYPTAVDTDLNIDLMLPQTIYIVNVAGKICAVVQGQAGHNSISLQAYPAGMYLVRLSNETVKVIKR